MENAAAGGVMRAAPFVAVLALVLVFNARAEAGEICGDRLDNDGNGMTDEGCYPAQQTGVC